MTLFAELLHRSADAREVLRTCTGSSWQVEGRERAGCLPWCFSSLQPLPGATERCLPCPALVNTSCPPALPALPPLLPPSYHSAFPPPPLLRLSLPIFFPPLSPSFRRVPSALPTSRALFISSCRILLRAVFLSPHLPWGWLSSRFLFLSLCVLLSFPFIMHTIFSFPFFSQRSKFSLTFPFLERSCLQVP